MLTQEAVIYAGWFPNLERSSLYIDDLKKTFPDQDVYVGVNPSGTNFHKTLSLIGYEVAIAPDETVVNSDASAFQAGLRLFKQANILYDTVYFIHTKAMSYGDMNHWWSSYDSYYRGFLRQVTTIRNILKTDTSIGGVSLIGRKEPMNHSDYSSLLNKYHTFEKDYTVEDMMSLLTVYAIRGNIVKTFIDNINPSFFTDKLDRYFFETTFPLIIDRMGYKRKHLNIWET